MSRFFNHRKEIVRDHYLAQHNLSVYLKQPFKKRWVSDYHDNAYYWALKIIGIFLAIAAFVFNWISYITPIAEWASFHAPGGNLAIPAWFNSLGTFTVQSNWFIGLTLIIYLIRPQSKIFKNYWIITAVCTYIVITFIGYNFFIGIRSNFSSWKHTTTLAEKFKAAASIWQHVVGPVFIVLFFILDARNYRCRVASLQDIVKPQKNNYMVIVYGLIYPLMFLIYALVISLTHVYVIYNGFTNVDSDFGQIHALNGYPSDIYSFVKTGPDQYSWYDNIVNLNKNNLSANQITLLFREQSDNYSFGNISFGKAFNIIYYVVFVILFSLFLFMFQYIFNRRVKNYGFKAFEIRQDPTFYYQDVKEAYLANEIAYRNSKHYSKDKKKYIFVQEAIDKQKNFSQSKLHKM